jgi:predicted NACHT family NTPase
MSINSINHDEITDITAKWEESEEVETQRPVSKNLRSAEARRRIETMREIRESGLTIEEAKELGLLH